MRFERERKGERARERERERESVSQVATRTLRAGEQIVDPGPVFCSGKGPPGTDHYIDLKDNHICLRAGETSSYTYYTNNDTKAPNVRWDRKQHSPRAPRTNQRHSRRARFFVFLFILSRERERERETRAPCRAASERERERERETERD